MLGTNSTHKRQLEAAGLKLPCEVSDCSLNTHSGDMAIFLNAVIRYTQGVSFDYFSHGELNSTYVRPRDVRLVLARAR